MTLDEPNRQSGLAHSYPQKRKIQRKRYNPSELGPRKHVSERKREGTPLTTAADENELVFA